MGSWCPLCGEFHLRRARLGGYCILRYRIWFRLKRRCDLFQPRSTCKSLPLKLPVAHMLRFGPSAKPAGVSAGGVDSSHLRSFTEPFKLFAGNGNYCDHGLALSRDCLHPCIRFCILGQGNQLVSQEPLVLLANVWVATGPLAASPVLSAK